MEFQVEISGGTRSFKKTQLEIMWKLLVEEATCQEERDVFFFYAMKLHDSGASS